jgi:hypothetical protein
MNARLLAWALFAAWLAIALLNLAVVAAGTAAADETVWLVGMVGWALVGAVVASRQPRNPVGWILGATAVAVALESISIAYAEGAAPGDLAFAAAVFAQEWVYFVWLALAAVALPLTFPNGLRPGRRWRALAWIATAGTGVAAIGSALKPGMVELDSPHRVENPLGVPGADVLMSALQVAGVSLLVVGFVGGAVAVVSRLRRARGIERQQVKWFAYVAALMVGGFVLAFLSLPFGPGGVPGALGLVGWGGAIVVMTFGIPLATVAAILRHRLYDIDVVIRRTAVYGALSATLLAAYLGMVLVLQLALNPLTQESDLAIAGSTLAVAALFRPARARIQELVDRRFYRSRYDAARTVEAFSARLRNEVELAALSTELRTVARETMQPAHVSLWLRPESGR